MRLQVLPEEVGAAAERLVERVSHFRLWDGEVRERTVTVGLEPLWWARFRRPYPTHGEGPLTEPILWAYHLGPLSIHIHRSWD